MVSNCVVSLTPANATPSFTTPTIEEVGFTRVLENVSDCEVKSERWKKKEVKKPQEDGGGGEEGMGDSLFTIYNSCLPVQT